MKALQRFAHIVVYSALVLGMHGAVAKEHLHIDGSSEIATNESFGRMLATLDDSQKIELHIAILKLALAGVESAQQVMDNPRLQNISPSQVKHTIAGLTAAQIVDLAKDAKLPQTYLEGQEPGIPADLLTSLDAGSTASAPLTATRWKVTSNTNGHVKEEILAFNTNGVLIDTRQPGNEPHLWEQSGAEVRLFFNNRFAVYRGRLDGTTMFGEAGNKNGTRWTWTAERL